MPVRRTAAVGALAGVGEVGDQQADAARGDGRAELLVESVDAHGRRQQADGAHVEARLERARRQHGVDDAAGGMADQVQADGRQRAGLDRAELLEQLDRTGRARGRERIRSEEHTSELQSLMRISYAVFCLKKNNYIDNLNNTRLTNRN